GKSLFGKRGAVEVKRSGVAEQEAQAGGGGGGGSGHPSAPATNGRESSTAAAAVAAGGAAQSVANATKAGDTATTTKGQTGGRRLATDIGGTYREPGGERGRGTRSAAE
ncbi:unnamed protein product, partial [Ectocarpus sp. 12 AP-2014]